MSTTIKDIATEIVTFINDNPLKHSAKDLNSIIDQYFKKLHPVIPAAVSSPVEVDLDEQMMVNKDRFVPSAQLLQNYQAIYQSSINPIEKIQPPKPQPRLPLFSKTATNAIWLDRPRSSASRTAPLVEQREQTILANIREGKLQSTLIGMERSLRNMELKSLERKQVKVQNVVFTGDSMNQQVTRNVGLELWKNKRQSLMKQHFKK